MKTNFGKLRVYQMSEQLADLVWDVVVDWPALARITVGTQLIRAADSVEANIAEGVGRGRYQDNRRFVRTARGSLNEVMHFLRRAYRRKLLNAVQTERIKEVLDPLAPSLDAYLKSIGPTTATEQEDN